MMSFVPLFIYRIGKLSVCERIGYYGGLLFASSYFVHELCTGLPPSDHNDIAFLFYITASIWAWVEYEKSQKKYWLIFIGLFSGCAILIKWLTGLLVFSGWGLSILFDKERRKSFESYKSIGLSIIICCIIFIPWQLYILHAFPGESSYEYSLNSKHFFTVVEEHGGDSFYYYDNLKEIYGKGDLIPLIILTSLFFMYRNIYDNKFRIAFFSYILLVYLFFSFAATKMVAFCFIVSPFIFLSLATMIERILNFIKLKILKKHMWMQIFTVIILCLVVSENIDVYRIALKHTPFLKPNDNDGRASKLYDAIFIKSLKNYLPSPDYVIFNCKSGRNIPVMFYTSFVAYNKPLDYENYIYLKSKKINIATIDNGKLAEFIKNDTSVIKIKAPDKTWE